MCAQSADDAERLRALGARRVEVTGNLKFDVAPNAAQAAAGRAWREALGRRVLLLASTREGEERPAPQRGSALPADVLTVVVPRHPQRFDEVAALAQSRRTRNPAPAREDRVHLGDTMGEMAFYFAAADVAVIGGSFLPLGGQNLIESLALGTPVRQRPEHVQLRRGDAPCGRGRRRDPVRRCGLGDPARGASSLNDAVKRREMGEAGRRLCEAHRGAAARQLAVCLELVRARAPG